MDFGLTPESLRAGLIFYFLLFAVLILRAFAQAWLADRMGDPTPRSDGRVTLYPPPHVDLLTAMPVHVIINADAGLIGAAVSARSLATG